MSKPLKFYIISKNINKIIQFLEKKLFKYDYLINNQKLDNKYINILISNQSIDNKIYKFDYVIDENIKSINNLIKKQIYKSNPIIIYLIRHGQTYANVGKPKYPFNENHKEPLNEIGKIQAKITGKYLKDRFNLHNIKINFITSSPFDRAINTAQIINKYIGNKPIYIFDNLYELHTKDNNIKKTKEKLGLSKILAKISDFTSDYIDINDELTNIWYKLSDKLRTKDNKFIESYKFTKKRLMNSLYDQIYNYHHNGTIINVSHSKIIQNYIKLFLNLEDNIFNNLEYCYNGSNCMIATIKYDGKFTVLTLPNTKHLNNINYTQILWKSPKLAYFTISIENNKKSFRHYNNIDNYLYDKNTRFRMGGLTHLFYLLPNINKNNYNEIFKNYNLNNTTYDYDENYINYYTYDNNFNEKLIDKLILKNYDNMENGLYSSFNDFYKLIKILIKTNNLIKTNYKIYFPGSHIIMNLYYENKKIKNLFLSFSVIF